MGMHVGAAGSGQHFVGAANDVGAAMHEVYAMRVRVGQFLPPDDSASARAFVVLGPKLKRELFDAGNALGERVQIGDERYRVIGIMEEKGEFLGVDLDDTAFIPSVRGLALFKRDGLMEIGVAYAGNVPVAPVVDAVTRSLITRHGREDFSVRTQEDMLATLSNILDILTAAVGALGGISLLAAGCGFWWAWIDRERLTWHDRISRTRMIRETKQPAK